MAERLEVPDGMLKVAHETWLQLDAPTIEEIRSVLRAALRWQAEHPPAFSDEQIEKFRAVYFHGGVCAVINEAFKAAYSAEPELPEALKALMITENAFKGGGEVCSIPVAVKKHNDKLVEAYKIGAGLKAGSGR